MFQRIHALDPEMNPATKSAHIAAILTGNTYEEVRQWRIEKVKKTEQIFTTMNYKPYERKRVRFIDIHGVRHRITDNPAKMSSGQLIDLIELMKNNSSPSSYMDMALAIITIEDTFTSRTLERIGLVKSKYDSTKVEERREYIKDIPLKDVWGVWVFFWNLWIRYCTISEAYLEREMMTTTQKVKSLLTGNGLGS